MALVCFICEVSVCRAELRAEFPTVGASCLSDALEASLRETAAFPPHACDFPAGGAAAGSGVEDCGKNEEDARVTGRTLCGVFPP